MSSRHPLEPSAQAMREMIGLATERIVAHIESLPTQPGSDTEGAETLARGLIEDIPETGAPLPDLLRQLFDDIVPKSLNCASPGFMAYIPGGGLFHAAVADLIANSVNRYTTVWVAAPGMAQLESNVVRWFCDMVDYPATSGGFLASGGSVANLSAVVTARRDRLPEDFLSGTIYAADQVHHSIDKAALLAGFPARNVRGVPVDGRFRIRIDLLRERIRRDRAAGATPFMVVGSAGTTNTGAVDDLEALADLAAAENLWFHVDAAYGGFFMLTQRGRAAMPGIGRADSITLDPHKGLFLPYGTGCLLARDRDTLERAHRVDADYMPAREQPPEFVDFSDISPELSRGFRGLRVWLPLKMHGSRVFRDALDEKLDLAELATAELRKLPGIEIVAAPQLSLVAFRLVRDGLDEAGLNALNRKLVQSINARQRIHLTGTLVGGKYVVRICVLSLRTHRDRVELGLTDIRSAVVETLATGAA